MIIHDLYKQYEFQIKFTIKRNLIKNLILFKNGL